MFSTYSQTAPESDGSFPLIPVDLLLLVSQNLESHQNIVGIPEGNLAPLAPLTRLFRLAAGKDLHSLLRLGDFSRLQNGLRAVLQIAIRLGLGFGAWSLHEMSKRATSVSRAGRTLGQCNKRPKFERQ